MLGHCRTASLGKAAPTSASLPAGAATPVLGRTLAGYLFAPLSLLYVLVFYFCAARWLGWWTPMEELVQPNLLAHFWPWLTPLAGAMQAGPASSRPMVNEPRPGPTSLLGEHFGGRRKWIGAALVVQAVIFAGAHANYPGQPGYSRLVELIVPSLIFGAFYLRFGLLPGIVLHFTYDIVLMALPLFAATSSGIWLDRGAVVLLALLPLWIVLWRRWRTGATAELPAGFWNRDWTPAAALPPELPRPSGNLVASEVTPWLWRGTLAIAVLGAAAWINHPCDTARSAARRRARRGGTDRTGGARGTPGTIATGRAGAGLGDPATRQCGSLRLEHGGRLGLRVAARHLCAGARLDGTIPHFQR